MIIKCCHGLICSHCLVHTDASLINCSITRGTSSWVLASVEHILHLSVVVMHSVDRIYQAAATSKLTCKPRQHIQIKHCCLHFELGTLS